MEALSEVCSLLRYNNYHNLAGLLAHAHVDFEEYDVAFAMAGDAEFTLANAVIYAPVSAANKLRSLNRDDSNAILEAIGEVWPVGQGGGIAIQDIQYRIDTDSLHDEPLTPFTHPTGWDRVDRTMDKLREQLMTATTEEDFEQIGHRCREALISLAQATFDRQRHSSISDDGKKISSTDVKRMIEQYLAVEFSGPGNQAARKCVRSTYDLAVALQHSRDATYRDAALCVQATFGVVGLIEIISGKRGRAVAQPDSS